MRLNLTKKDIINSLYLQIGYPKKVTENVLEDLFNIIFDELKKNGKDATMADIIESIRRRDALDMKRATDSESVGVKVIDTSTCSVEDVVAMIMADL